MTRCLEGKLPIQIHLWSVPYTRQVKVLALAIATMLEVELSYSYAFLQLSSDSHTFFSSCLLLRICLSRSLCSVANFYRVSYRASTSQGSGGGPSISLLPSSSVRVLMLERSRRTALACPPITHASAHSLVLRPKQPRASPSKAHSAQHTSE